MIADAAVSDYITFFENLTPESLNRFEEVFTSDARFRDPFNDAQGVAAVRRVFEKMFDDVDEHKFKVQSYAVNGNSAYLVWVFEITPKGKKKVWLIEGMSRIDFRDDGKATAHIDYYDAAGQIYEKIPLIGGVLRLMRRKIAA